VLEQNAYNGAPDRGGHVETGSTTGKLRGSDDQPLDLWSGDWSSDWENVAHILSPTMGHCGAYDIETGTPYDAQTPAGAWTWVPVKYQMAHRLGLGRLTPCWDGSSLEIHYSPGNQNGTDYRFMVAKQTLDRYCHDNCAGYGSQGAAFDRCWNDGCGEEPWNELWASESHPHREYTDQELQESCRQDYQGFHEWFCGDGGPSKYTHEVVERELMRLRIAFLGGLVSDGGLVDNDLAANVRHLDGVGRLIGAYANLGLRSALGADDELSGLVNGSDPLYGEAAIVREITGYRAELQEPQRYWWETPSPGDWIGDKLDAKVSSLEARLRAAIDAGSDHSNPLVTSVLDTLSLASFAAARSLPVSITAPAAGANLEDARPTFSGTAAKDADNAIPTTVRVRIHQGLDTGAAPVATATVQPASRAWGVQAPAALANGTYTAVAEETGRDGHTGTSEAVTFTIAVRDTPGGTDGGGGGGGGTDGGGGDKPGGGDGDDRPALDPPNLSALLRTVTSRTALTILRGRKTLRLVYPGAGRLDMSVTVKQGRRTVVLATGTAASGAKLKLKPTAAGRQRLEKSGRLKLRWVAKFTPASAGGPITATRTVTVNVPRRH
jgi:hypothetical protein